MSQPAARLESTVSPNSQGVDPGKKRRPAFLQELPSLRFWPPEPNESAPLIPPDQLEELLRGKDPVIVKRILDDIDFLEYELLRLFRQRDHAGKYHQNRYRKYQLGYVVLATVAAMVGSAQALALAGRPEIMPLFALVETLIALMATFMATLGSRDAPMPQWLKNRRSAEELRREYFRFLLRLPPYDTLEGPRLSLLLSRRAADIFRGEFPDSNQGYEA